MILSAKHLLHKHEDLTSNTQQPPKWMRMVVCTSDSCAGEAENWREADHWPAVLSSLLNNYEE